jgi:hypothetical protein
MKKILRWCGSEPRRRHNSDSPSRVSSFSKPSVREDKQQDVPDSDLGLACVSPADPQHLNPTGPKGRLDVFRNISAPLDDPGAECAECARLRAENRRLATELANVSTQLDSARAQLSYYSRQER